MGKSHRKGCFLRIVHAICLLTPPHPPTWGCRRLSKRGLSWGSQGFDLVCPITNAKCLILFPLLTSSVTSDRYVTLSELEFSTRETGVTLPPYQGCWGISVVAKSCLTLCNSMDCSPPGSSVRGIAQARILESVAISFSWGSSRPVDRTQVFCKAGGFFTTEPPGKGYNTYKHTHTHI